MKIYILIKIPRENTKNIVEVYDKAADDIIKELYKMEPYVDVMHASGTNVISADVRWKGTQIATKLKRIKNNRHVYNYIIDYDPLKDLKESIDHHDFFKTYTLGCTLFEAYGIKILKKYFDKENIHVTKDKMDRLNLLPIIIMLYTHKLVNDKFYNYMTQINTIRNTLIVHTDITERLDEKTLEQTTQYIDKVQLCVNKLNSIYSSL